ncbi:NAD(P)-binding protein [Vararia minispora EC-137]|uniref:NAD(P)-binding protein n=1 Tax=Vararia minispora EC-137 TaxID=1314806 RepID=A0ACB8QGJ1_9AGAM|nr:NAD(P)-binding protein [Vararia minispora EC-137]
MGNTGSALAQMFPPKPKWGVENMPDLSGKVMIVTGGNTGVGKETVKALLSHGAKVYIAARTAEKTKAAIDNLKTETGREAIFLQLDLSDLVSVKRAAQEFLNKESVLHALFNNAGVMTPPITQLTRQGYDMQNGTNVLGHFYFTRLLLPALQAVHAYNPSEKARIVITSSSVMYLTTLNMASFEDGPTRRKMGTTGLYHHSKHANVVLACELARRYGDSIVTTSVNPGNLRTELQRYMTPVQKFFIDLVLYPAPMGALTQLYAGTAPEAAGMNGEFFKPWARVAIARKEAVDPEAGAKLWSWMEIHTKNI